MFDLIDGQFVKRGEKVFDSSITENFLFRETVRVIRNRLMFWNEHVSQIISRLLVLKQNIPQLLQDNAKELKRQAERTLVKNKLFKSARIDIIFFQNNNNVSYLIFTEAISQTEYEFNTEGIVLESFADITKAINPFSNSAMGSEPYWKILHTSQQMFAAEFMLLNEQGCIVEVPGKNIYLVKGNHIHTPARETGTYLSIAREMIRIICESQKFPVSEDMMITSDDLYAADEVFLSNDLYGIQWVKGYGMKRYRNKTTRLLNEEFNRILGI